MTNVQSWVSNLNGTSTTAFAIQNIGSKAITVTDIKFRGIPVPTASWWSCQTCASGAVGATNIQTPLPADYTEDFVNIGNPPVNYAMSSGIVSLSQGAAAIVYLADAGNVDAIDSGNTYALQIQAGQASSVTQVSVESK